MSPVLKPRVHVPALSITLIACIILAFLVISHAVSTNDSSVTATSVEASAEGLLIHGTFASAPESTRQPTLYVWLTDAREPLMPGIGWGNQFGNRVLAKMSDCSVSPQDTLTIEDPAACKSWYRDQEIFRTQFRKLFVREWMISPELTTELYATLSYKEMPDYVQNRLNMMAPTGTPIMTLNAAASGQFTITIPWNALPPISSLTIEQVRLHLTTRPESDLALSTFSIFSLPNPRTYKLTSCTYPLQPYVGISSPTFSDEAHAYIMPGNATTLYASFTLDNVMEGYQYEPDASSTSPTAYPISYFEKKIGPDETLCGPQLSILKAGRVTDLKSTAISTSSISIAHVNDANMLIQNGPFLYSSWYGSGMCGACDHARLSMIHLNSTTGVATTAYEFFTVFDQNDARFQISPDKKSITEYTYTSPEGSESTYDSDAYIWTARKWCYNSATTQYDACGTSTLKNPPTNTLPWSSDRRSHRFDDPLI